MLGFPWWYCEHLMKIKIPLLNQKNSCNRKGMSTNLLQSVFLTNWDSLRGRLNCHNKTWSYNRKKKAHRKDVWEPKEKMCLWTQDLKLYRSQDKERQKEFCRQNSRVYDIQIHNMSSTGSICQWDGGPSDDP